MSLTRWLDRAAALPFSIAITLGVAQAQTAQSYIPTPSNLSNKVPDFGVDAMSLPAQPDAAPRQIGRPDSEITYNVTKYVVDDSAPRPLRDAIDDLTRAYIGPNRTFSDLTEATRQVTRYLQGSLGYYLGYAYLPEQTPTAGVIRIATLEGRLDGPVEVLWDESLQIRRDTVEGFLAQLKPGAVLLVSDVERVVFLVNDLRGISAEFEVSPGSLPGTAKLVAKLTPRPLLEWNIEADNNSSKYLGEERIGATLVLNDPLGLGDSASLSVKASAGLQFALVNYTAPAGSSGLRAGVSMSGLSYAIDKKFFPLGLKGSASTTSAFLLYPHLRSRNINLFYSVTAEYKEYRDFNGLMTYPKKVTDALVAATGDIHDDLLGGGINSYGASLTSGTLKFDITPGGNTAPENFQKLNFNLARLQNIVSSKLQAYASIRMQKADMNLDISEQIHVGGVDGVRAFTEGEGAGDTGAIASLELRALLPSKLLPESAQGYISLFVDQAKILQHTDLSGEPATFVNELNYGGNGIGATLTTNSGWEIRATYAVRTLGTPADPSDTSTSRFYIQASKHF